MALAHKYFCLNKIPISQQTILNLKYTYIPMIRNCIFCTRQIIVNLEISSVNCYCYNIHSQTFYCLSNTNNIDFIDFFHENYRLASMTKYNKTILYQLNNFKAYIQLIEVPQTYNITPQNAIYYVNKLLKLMPFT
jgi:hypothetical protein